MVKLTGIMIQKLLPNTNCKECGSNTCMAFAMKLAAKKAELSACPYVSEEAKRIIGTASEPPVKTIDLGLEKKVKIGGETVLYRHEKTFVHPTLFAINISDNDSPNKIDATIKQIQNYQIVRAGQTSRIDLVSITHQKMDMVSFSDLVQKVWDATKRPLIIHCSDMEILASAAKVVKSSHSIIASATPTTVTRMKQIAAENDHALVISSQNIDEIVGMAENLKKDQFDNLILEFQAQTVAEVFQLNSISRRAALKDNVKPMGYPILHVFEKPNDLDETIMAITEISKYGGICVFPSVDFAQLTALITLRMNLYTDPQKPIQVEPKIYPIGEPNKTSRVFVTTNFSLTFFIVSGEIENSGISAWLVVPECEGMSVLTAWAAGKFNAKTIAKFIKEVNFENQITTREIILPGLVAQISGELEDSLPGWKVLVGPQDAADIESYVKSLK